MSLPEVAREYRLTKADGTHNVNIQEFRVGAPKASEVLVKVHAVSLQYRDLLVSRNVYPLGQIPNVVPCSDMAGEVVAIGEGVNGWNVGDRVCANFSIDHVYGPLSDDVKRSILGGTIDGVLTEYKLLPAHCLVRIPEHLSYEEASTLPCAALTAYNALMGPVPVKGGDTVLVQGTGGVSVFALQFAVASSATVIATSSSDEKLKVAAELGATHLVNYRKTPDWETEVLRVGVDRIIEVGGPGTLEKSAKCIAYAGWINVIGHVTEDGDISSVPMHVLKRSAFIRGILVGPRTLFEDMNRLIGAAKIKPVVGKVFSFEEARVAYQYLESQKHIDKVVIRVSKD